MAAGHVGAEMAAESARCGCSVCCDLYEGTPCAELLPRAGREECVEKKKRSIIVGAAAAAAAYGLTCTMLHGDSALSEDMVDMLHSVYTSLVAARGIFALRRHAVFEVALPPGLEEGTSPVLRMFCHSTGYFLADVCLVVFELCVRRQLPRLWAGRLAHHAIQLATNFTCIFTVARTEERLAIRSGLCIAYFAEFSSVFLRLNNLVRRSSALSGRRSRCCLTWSLLISFALCRLVNFGFLIRCWLKARPVVSPTSFHLMLGIQIPAYAMNVGWFMKIARSAVRLHVPVRGLGS